MRRTVCIVLLSASLFLDFSWATSGSQSIREGRSLRFDRPTSPYSSRLRSKTPRTYAPRARVNSRRSASGMARDAHGRIKRSTSAKNAFRRQRPCPSTGKSSGPCPGYVVDHVKPLECGGADAPSNMQWQTIADGKAKDKTEHNCR